MASGKVRQQQGRKSFEIAITDAICTQVYTALLDESHPSNWPGIREFAFYWIRISPVHLKIYLVAMRFAKATRFLVTPTRTATDTGTLECDGVIKRCEAVILRPHFTSLLLVKCKLAEEGQLHGH
ncbi:predicted protein [Coccidioides posadasii str. Silveira]|uniref:Predicted protein n=1 Tax=Coccidioides posadasii (strain RMSCC 757 / Silveira) TaxID=443226 RepID=E9CTG1_COCPS|nr:predicted protein [Coccidioides posadasii str. Silveira]